MKKNPGFFKKTLVIIISIIFIGMIINTSTSALIEKENDWWNQEWEYRKEITIDHNMVNEDLENFPILFHSISSNYSHHAQPNGDDFAFVSTDGAIQFNHEIEYYGTSSGELIAWVNVTTLSSTEDTSLYIYYGNPDSINQENIICTWDSNFVGVWHCNNDVNNVEGGIKDSTVYKNNGTTQNMEQGDLVDGKISKAINFGGVDEKVMVYDSEYGSLSLTESMTLECWWNSFDLSNSTDALMGKGSTYNYQYEYRIRDSYDIDNRYSLLTTQGLHEDNITHSTDTWYYGTVTLDSENIIFYNEGTASSVHGTTNPLPVNAQFGFGAAGDYGRYFEGMIDEVRISKIARSAGWVETCYNSMNNPDTFLFIGSEETRPFYNLPPDAPSVDGPMRWPAGIEVSFLLHSTDPNDDNVKYEIDWGDGTTAETEYVSSCTPIEVCNTWEKMDDYLMQVRAVDTYGLASDWTTKEVEIQRPRTSIYLWYHWLFDTFPILEKLLGLINII